MPYIFFVSLPPFGSALTALRDFLGLKTATLPRAIYKERPKIEKGGLEHGLTSGSWRLDCGFPMTLLGVGWMSFAESKSNWLELWVD